MADLTAIRRVDEDGTEHIDIPPVPTFVPPIDFSQPTGDKLVGVRVGFGFGTVGGNR